MQSITLNKYPPQKDGINQGGLCEYLRYYGLILDRFKWAADDQNPTLQYDDIQRYIAQLIDPLAFQGNHTQTVKNIETEFNHIKNNNDWNGQKFTIRTIIEDTGTHGGLITATKNATIRTLAGVGSHSGSIHGDSIRFPPNDQWLETRMQIDTWKTAFDNYYSSPENNILFEISFKPAENTQFEFYFKAQTYNQ